MRAYWKSGVHAKSVSGIEESSNLFSTIDEWAEAVGRNNMLGDGEKSAELAMP